MAQASQGVYAPLPQSLSDSDSEREQLDDLSTKSLNGVKKNFQQTANGYTIASRPIENTKPHHGFKSMSLARKYCFLFSILVCFLTIVIFLWVLPCSKYDTCPMRISNWESRHEGFEFKGRINVVDSPFPDVQNLALLFERSLNGMNQNGAICILGNDGGIGWYIPQGKVPTKLNCNLIDVNGDGSKDCLLQGATGLEAIDPISGQILYNVHKHNSLDKDINKIDIPVIIPDLNGDGISEMVTFMTKGKAAHNNLITICGRTGVLLKSFFLRHCLEAQMLKYENKIFLYSCKNPINKSFFKITYDDIKNCYYNETCDVTSLTINIIDTENSEYILDGHKLLVNNSGACPICEATLHLENDKGKKLWSFSYNNSYIMKPTVFTFKSTKPNVLSLQGHISGYILKLWEFTKSKVSVEEHIEKIYIPVVNATIHTNIIYERIILVTFNDTNVNVINASFVKITQLCFLMDGDYKCQPNLENQQESLLITDLDNDDSQELISYSSTFDYKGGVWKLLSKINVVRLEDELPKLYEVDSLK